MPTMGLLSASLGSVTLKAMTKAQILASHNLDMAEVVHWCRRTDSSATQGSRQFAPALSSADRRVLANAIDYQLRKSAPTTPTKPPGEVVKLVPTPTPTPTGDAPRGGSMTDVEWYRWSLDEVTELLMAAKSLGQSNTDGMKAWVSLHDRADRFRTMLRELEGIQDSDQSVDAIIARIHVKTGKTGTGP